MTRISNEERREGGRPMTTPSPTLDDVLFAWGATHTKSQDDGVVDFRIGEVPGMAYLKGRGQRTLRASFFIAFDPDRQEADSWIVSMGQPSKGQLQSIRDDRHRTAVRFVVELPLTDDTVRGGWPLRRMVEIYRAAWERRHEGIGDMLLTLAQAGVPCPPLAGHHGRVGCFGPWHWGTRACDPFDLYMFDVPKAAALAASADPMFLFAHAGHGFNSYGLNLAVTSGPVAAYVQHGYGGAFMEPVSTLVDIAATYARLTALFNHLEEPAGQDVLGPRSTSAAARWMLVYSQFRGHCGLLDLDRIREGTSVDDAMEAADDEPALFALAASKFPHVDFGFGVPVRWAIGATHESPRPEDAISPGPTDQ